MKEAVVTNLDGLYIDITLVADSVTGVFVIQQPKEYGEDEERPEVPKLIDIGYTAAYSVPPGLYKPKFDLTGYNAAQAAYETAMTAYNDALAQWNEESGEDRPTPPSAVYGSGFWAEGLTPEEIEAMKPVPVLHPLETLGAQMVQGELEALELRTQNEVLGGQIIEKDLQLLDLKAQNEAIGGNVVALELRLLDLEAKANV